jgi:FMN reductase (NADPH)
MNIASLVDLSPWSKKKRLMPNKVGPFGFIRGIYRILRGKPRIPKSLQDNKLLKTILKRRSVRVFTSQEIPEDVFAAILEAGRVAPSAVNLQSWTFGVFTPESWKETFGRGIPFRAQRAVIIMGDIHRAKTVITNFPYSPLVEYTTAVMNASLAVMNMNIAAEALGVSSVMLSETGRTGVLDVGYLKEVLQLPEGVFPLTTIVFGYAKSFYPPMPPRLPIEQVTLTQKYQEPDPKIMKDWMEQMVAGFKSTHLTSSFDNQLNTYLSKISDAESDLHGMVFYQDYKE